MFFRLLKDLREADNHYLMVITIKLDLSFSKRNVHVHYMTKIHFAIPFVQMKNFAMFHK